MLKNIKMHRLVWSFAGRKWHKIHFRMTQFNYE